MWRSLGANHHGHGTPGNSSRQAVRRAGLTQRATSHTFRHSFPSHLLEDGYDIQAVQELSGHKDAKTTMIYTHVLNRRGHGVKSPADTLGCMTVVARRNPVCGIENGVRGVRQHLVRSVRPLFMRVCKNGHAPTRCDVLRDLMQPV